PIYVFSFPAPIPAKWLVTFAVAVSLVLALLPAADGVAHRAHLGGFAAGFVYLKTADWRLRRAERHLRRLSAPGVLLHAAGAGRPGRADQAGGGRTADLGKGSAVERDPAHAEIDRVLDKISERGIHSLTAAERRFLAEMSRRMRDRR